MQPARKASPAKPASANRRLLIWYGALLLVIVIFIARLFYLQIIKYDHYRAQALSDQLKEYSITAERGVIRVQEGNETVPLVLNETLYTLYADPTLIKDVEDNADKLATITGGDDNEYERLLKTKNSRYVILAKRLTRVQKEKIENLRLPGVGAQAQNYRNYPQGNLASQLLGFVNNEGKGVYGIEQALNKELSGTPGQLKAITDAAGVPLAASRENILIEPKAGKDAVLTIDLAMQKQLEGILKKGLDQAKSKSGSALIIDPNTGAIKAMANWPSYDPARYHEVTDSKLFNNAAAVNALEVGSIMKVLTAAAALDQGAVKADTTYYDPNHWKLDGYEVTNIEETGPAGTRSVTDIINKSINTGATWLLMRMGGKNDEITKAAREKWHDYMVNHFHLGKPTGIEQGYEGEGYVPPPNKGFGLNLTYANTSFGQAMTATPLQMAAALSSVINGGTYYQPRLVESTIDGNGNKSIKKPNILQRNVVSAQVGQQVKALMENVVANRPFGKDFNSSMYSVGGKTGTAQIANPKGGYYTDKYNGTYLGFVGGDRPQYVIAIVVHEPGIGGYAGSAAAQPIFVDTAHMLIDNFNVNPKINQ